MAPHSRTLAWKTPWMEGPGGLQSMGLLRVGHDLVTSLSLFTFTHWRRKWQPIPVFLPGESQRRGSLVGWRLWSHTESDTTEATWQQQGQGPVGHGHRELSWTWLTAAWSSWLPPPTNTGAGHPCSWKALIYGNNCGNTPNTPAKQNTSYLYYVEQAQLVIETIYTKSIYKWVLFQECIHKFVCKSELA